MPLPLSDVTQAYRSAPEKTEQALTKVRSLLRLLQLSGSVLCRGPNAAVPACVRGDSVWHCGHKCQTIHDKVDELGWVIGCKKLGETTVSFETTVVVCGSCMEVSFVDKPWWRTNAGPFILIQMSSVHLWNCLCTYLSNWSTPPPPPCTSVVVFWRCSFPLWVIGHVLFLQTV